MCPVRGRGGVFTVNVSSLTPNTAYTFAAYASNSAGTGYSVPGNFTMLSPVAAWLAAKGMKPRRIF